MTGTPVSNSMSELYNMQRYLAPGTLKAQGLDTFAAWAGAYGQVVPTVELKPEATDSRSSKGSRASRTCPN